MSLTVNGSSISIALGNTYYGGYLDVINGNLVIDYKRIILSDPTLWRSSGGVVSYYYNTNAANDRLFTLNSTDYLTCSAFPVLGSSSTVDFCRWTSSTSYLFGVKLNSSMTLSDLETLTSSGDLEIMYKLANPITVSLTAQQIAAIKGVNSIATNTNGNIEVTYKESVKHYLDEHES